jgi:cytochrome bd-type quinol oxidase subunit 2
MSVFSKKKRFKIAFFILFAVTLVGICGIFEAYSETEESDQISDEMIQNADRVSCMEEMHDAEEDKHHSGDRTGDWSIINMFMLSSSTVIMLIAFIVVIRKRKEENGVLRMICLAVIVAICAVLILHFWQTENMDCGPVIMNEHSLLMAVMLSAEAVITALVFAGKNKERGEDIMSSEDRPI